MKNKKVTVYMLLFLCVVIWGTISWKVYQAFREEPIVIPQASYKKKKEEKDTIALLLNYRDPFIGEYPTSKTKEEEKTTHPTLPKEIYTEPIQEVLPDFQYKGIIRLGKNTQAMISQNGKSLMFKTKDKIGEFTILLIADDKLIVGRRNQKYELPLQ